MSKYRGINRSIKARHMLRGLVFLVAVAVMASLAVAGAAAEPPQERDYFGIVLSSEEGLLVINVEGTTVEIPTTKDTKVRLPFKKDAGFTDLTPGDFIAVTLEEKDGLLVADKVFLIPGKTQFRHIPGEVIAVSETQITIKPLGQGAEPLVFTRSSTTKIKFHKDTTEISVGSFVIIVAVRDKLTGELLPDAREIHVTLRKIDRGDGEGGKVEKPAIANTAEIQGVFEGVNPLNGNWIISGTEVAVDADTKIKDAVAVGQLVEVKAVLRPDGSLLAVQVEVKEAHREVSRKTKLQGIFEGVDKKTGAWIISGTQIFVGPGTDTDGLPYVGQRVEVVALSQEDGSLLAREIENKGGSRGRDDDSNEVEVKGIFQGVDEKDGSWIVNGVKVLVDPLTKLKGTPAVGSQVEVEAVLLENGSLLAKEIEAKGERGRKPKKDAEIKGTIDNIVVGEDGTRTLVINGLSVRLSRLTELDGDVTLGAFVEVKALLQDNGTLVAREVEVQGQDEVSGDGQPSEVKIEGTIESVSVDGTTLQVNGITVSISGLSEVKGNLVKGAFVKIEGVLLQDGSILAGELKGEGRRATTSRTEVKVEGLLEAINRDKDGNLVSVVVNGLTINAEALTELEGTLEVGRKVEIKGIINDKGFLASKIEGDEGEDQEDGEASELKIEGVIEAIQVDAQGRVIGITVNGVSVEVGALADVEGTLKVGATVEVKSTIRGGTVVAKKIEREELEQKKAEQTEFDLKGLVEAVERDKNGNIVRIVVNGLTITVEALTRVKGSLEPGSSVEVRGIIAGGTLLASKIKGDEKDSEKGAPGGRGVRDARETRIDGLIKSVQRDGDGKPVRVTVDGFDVGIADLTKIDGVVVEGARVKIKAVIRDGVLTATEIEVKGPSDTEGGDDNKGKGKD